MQNKPQAMRDVLIEELTTRIAQDDKIYFLSADFGSPALDKLRENFPHRFINVGIAEQNLINVATGLALEGFKVYVYAIAPFITMRCFEQIRVNLSILSQIRPMCVNIIGVGAGFSYDMSGPTHHCLEDLSIMGTLPNLEIFSPSDCQIVKMYIDETLKAGIRYLRFDAKPLQDIQQDKFDIADGFRVIKSGNDMVLLTTGFATHKALEYTSELADANLNIGIIDIFKPTHFEYVKLANEILKYNTLYSIEEGICGAGGLDAKIFNFLNNMGLNKKYHPLGMNGQYNFEIGSRDFLHRHFNMSVDTIKNQLTTI